MINWGKKIEIIVCYVSGLLLLLAAYFAGYPSALFLVSSRTLRPKMSELSPSMAAI